MSSSSLARNVDQAKSAMIEDARQKSEVRGEASTSAFKETSGQIDQHDNTSSFDGTDEEYDEDQAVARSVWLHDLPDSVPMPENIQYEELRMYDAAVGFYPMELGECFGPEHRFRTVAKLGFGGFGTVWLCKDAKPVSGGPPAWRAVKLLSATQSHKYCPELVMGSKLEKAGISGAEALERGILVPEDHVWLDSPHGRHLALVMPLMGSNLAHVSSALKYEASALKEICYQATRALGFVHDHGICHGDFRPNNILFRLEGAEYLDDDEMIDIIGRPICVPADETDEGEGDGCYPPYLVLASSFPFGSKYSTAAKVVLADFGASYDVNKPPGNAAIPWLYRAPDWRFGSPIRGSFGPDIWALAMTLMELRCGKCDFNTMDLNHLMTVYVSVAGLPPPKMVHTWNRITKAMTGRYRYQIGADGLPTTAHDTDKFGHPLMGALKSPPQVYVLLGPRERWEDIPCEDRAPLKGLKIVRIAMSDEEAKTLHNLLSTMIKWLPEERSSVAQVLKHAWFQEFQGVQEVQEVQDGPVTRS